MTTSVTHNVRRREIHFSVDIGKQNRSHLMRPSSGMEAKEDACELVGLHLPHRDDAPGQALELEGEIQKSLIAIFSLFSTD